MEGKTMNKFDPEQATHAELLAWARQVQKMAMKADTSTDNYDCWENHEELEHFILNGCKRDRKTTLSEKTLITNCMQYWKWRREKEGLPCDFSFMKRN
jgi:hypothetical protein